MESPTYCLSDLQLLEEPALGLDTEFSKNLVYADSKGYQ